jgi:sugar (pentulose or hexulose) kinase
MTVLAWDIGTSGVKAVVVGRDGRLLASARRAYGLTTLAPVDDAGRSTLPMLSWLDQRAVREAEAIAGAIDGPEQARLFGGILTAKDVVPKIAWLRDQRPAAWAATRWLLDCKEALVLRLTGRAVIDPAGASAFRLYDVAARRWSPEACERLGIPIELLPEVLPATAVAGGLLPAAAARLGLPAGLPVVVGAGDVPASQLGAGATDPGDAHVSLGTAVYFGITTDRPVADPAGQLGVLGHADPALSILWLEVATGGGALSWLLRVLGDGDDPGPSALAAVDHGVADVADEMDGLLFAPWLSGERVPVFDDRVRGAFVGLGLRHGRAHLIRALMEGVAYQMRWALDYGARYGVPIGTIRGVGGGFIGTRWTQIIADVLDRPIGSIEKPQDAAAVGAAACALVGIGAQPDLRFVRDCVRVERLHEPDPLRRARHDESYDRFQRLYGALAPLFAARGRATDAAAIHDAAPVSSTDAPPAIATVATAEPVSA